MARLDSTWLTRRLQTGNLTALHSRLTQKRGHETGDFDLHAPVGLFVASLP